MEKLDILDAGAALSCGCGPLLVIKSVDIPFKDATIAVPGIYTAAHILLRLWYTEVDNEKDSRFYRILLGIVSGEFDDGVIIH